MYSTRKKQGNQQVVKFVPIRHTRLAFGERDEIC